MKLLSISFLFRPYITDFISLMIAVSNLGIVAEQTSLSTLPNLSNNNKIISNLILKHSLSTSFFNKIILTKLTTVNYHNIVITCRKKKKKEEEVTGILAPRTVSFKNINIPTKSIYFML